MDLALGDLTRVAASTKGKSKVSVQVDDSQVRNLLEATWRAVSGPSLENFLETTGHDYFESEFTKRFAYAGDSASGAWPDLHEATEHIRSAQGFEPDWPINIRTEALFNFVTQDAEFSQSAMYAEMNVPGDAPDSVTAMKLQTAQEGRKANPIANFGGTDPRPILALTEVDAAAMLYLLSIHVMRYIATGLGGTVVT